LDGISIAIASPVHRLGLDRYFRAGQSVSDIIISTTKEHGFEKYQPSLPRITVTFSLEKKQWFIAWSHTLGPVAPPERESLIDSETAFSVLRSYLVDLWRRPALRSNFPDLCLKRVERIQCGFCLLCW
jgi:hypothetical protein